MKRRFSILGAVCLLLCAAGVASAATRTWTGNSPINSSWTNAANWGFGGGTAPVAGDDLVFPPGNLRLANSNSFPAGTIFNSILVTGTNYTLSGNAIVLNAGITNSAVTTGNNIINFPITLATNQVFSSPGSGSSVLVITGGVTNNGYTLTAAGITVIITGIISGSGDIQSLAGTFLLDAANTYSGATVDASGFLTLNTSLALGATSSGTTVNSAGTLGFQSNISVPEPITVIGRLINYSGTNTLTGELTLQSTPTSVDVRPNSMLILSNVVSGTGSLLKTNTGILRLAGDSDNTFIGSTTITAGTLLLSKTPNKKAISGPLTNSATVRLLTANQIESFVPVTVNSNAVFDVNALPLTIGSLSGPRGASVTLAGGTLSVGANGATTTFDGVISGVGGNLIKQGAGTFTLTGTNTLTGTTTVSAGTLFLNGNQKDSPITVSGGTLGGTGIVSVVNVLAGGILNPGTSPGTLNSFTVTFSAGSVFQVELNGTNAGSYDQLNVAGTVNLGGSTLSVVPGFTPPSGATFTIIANDGVDPVNGTFSGIPEGGGVVVGGTAFTVSYVGGTGNDVVLTVSGCADPCNLRIHNPADDHTVYIRWDPPLLPVSEYRIYRNGFLIDYGEPDRYGNFFIFYDAHLLAGHSYTYEVRAVFTNGVTSGPSNPLQITALPLQPKIGTNKVVTLLVRFSDYIEEPYPTNFVNDFMFNATNSIRKYMEEVSYGNFSIQGDTYGWYTVPNPGSNYCAVLFPNGLWYACNTAQILQHVYPILPPAVSNAAATANVLQVAVHGLGAVGSAGGGVAFYSATNGFNPGTIVHELGHTLSFLHASSLISCEGYPMGADLINLRTNNCFTLLYGDLYDPMGGGETFHYNTFFKEKAGWLPTNNIQWIAADGDYVLHAIERATNAIQTLRIDRGAESFLFLEYRTLTGFDGPTQTSTNGFPPTEGVMMRLRVTQFNFSDWETFWLQPVATTTTPWFDPYTGLHVRVLSQNGTTATVRISGMNYAFRVTDVQKTGPSGNNVRLTWNSVPGARYLIESSPNLTTWTNFVTSINATNFATTVTLTNAAIPARRYLRLAVDRGP